MGGHLQGKVGKEGGGRRGAVMTNRKLVLFWDGRGDVSVNHDGQADDLEVTQECQNHLWQSLVLMLKFLHGTLLVFRKRIPAHFFPFSSKTSSARNLG
jgi:hypothetical protein